MSTDKPKPAKIEATEEVSTPPESGTTRPVGDWENYNSRVINDLRGGTLQPPSLPDVSYFDSTAPGSTDATGIRDARPGGLRGQNPDGPLSSDPVVRAQQIINRSIKLGEPMDPVSRAQKAFQDFEPYKAPDGTIRLRPREEQPSRPGELPPKLAKELRQLADDIAMHPPLETGKLPSPEEQTRLKEQAKTIAEVIQRNGKIADNGELKSMFEAATRSGEDSLNFLVKSVNDELKNAHSDLQLEYSFDTESAWYSKDTHGADIYYQPQEVKENHSMVGLVRTSTQQNLVSQHIEDRIKSRASMAPPGYVKSSNPNARLILLDAE